MSTISPKQYHIFREDEYFKIIALKTNDNILCAMETDMEYSQSSPIKVIEPMVMETYRRQVDDKIEETTILRPWQQMSDSDYFMIDPFLVTTIGNMREDIKEYYINTVKKIVLLKTAKRFAKETDDHITRFLGTVHDGPVRFIEEPEMQT